MTLHTPAGISLPASTILGYRKSGAPIYNIAGGSTPVVPAEPVITIPETVVEPPKSAEPRFTAEDIQKARAEEKDKLYGKIQTIEEQNKKFLTEIEAQRKAREEAEAAEATKAAEKAATAKAKSEDEMSAKQLLAQKDKEWQDRFAQIEQERQTERTLFEKEKQFTELQGYVQRRVLEEKENIAPELYDYVTGNTPDEVEASIKAAVDKTNAIFASVQEAAIQQRATMRGVSPTGFTTTGPMDAEPGTKTYSLEELRDMPLPEYAKIRGKLGVGNAAQNNRGLFS